MSKLFEETILKKKKSKHMDGQKHMKSFII
jgi:hypothetical protein